MVEHYNQYMRTASNCAYTYVVTLMAQVNVLVQINSNNNIQSNKTGCVHCLIAYHQCITYHSPQDNVCHELD